MLRTHCRSNCRLHVLRILPHRTRCLKLNASLDFGCVDTRVDVDTEWKTLRWGFRIKQMHRARRGIAWNIAIVISLYYTFSYKVVFNVSQIRIIYNYK